MPARVQAFCHRGRFHPIQVEDDVTAYMEWANGANGTFITSTGDAPGVNRLEISLEEAMLVCEDGELRIGELAPEIGMKEADYRRTTKEYFRKLTGSWQRVQPRPSADPYREMLENFRDAALTGAKLIAPGREGKNSLTLSNAMYLSDWEHRMVELPRTSAEERDFSAKVEEHLRRLIREYAELP